jgi:hypothetical protein
MSEQHPPESAPEEPIRKLDEFVLDTFIQKTSPDFPQMPDAKGCLATAVAYALSTFGHQAEPTDIDSMMGREPGLHPTQQNQIALQYGLLQAGYALEHLLDADAVDMADYFQDGSLLTYADYVGQFIRRFGPDNQEWFDTEYTEAVFTADMAHRRQVDGLFTPYRHSGQLVVTRADITPEYLQSRLDTAVLLCSTWSEDDSAHSAVVDGIQVFDEGINLNFFNPKHQEPSVVYNDSIESLEDRILLDHPLTLISPTDGQPAIPDFTTVSK